MPSATILVNAMKPFFFFCSGFSVSIELMQGDENSAMHILYADPALLSPEGH